MRELLDTPSAIYNRVLYRTNHRMREKILANHRERYHNDEEYRKRENERTKAWYSNLKQDPERYRAFLLQRKEYYIKKKEKNGKEKQD